MLNTFRKASFASFVAAAVLFAATPASAQRASATTGAVRLNIVKAGFIVGMGGGEGTLTFRGRTYPISVGGIGLGSLGIASVRLAGTASNLRTAADIAGTYGSRVRAGPSSAARRSRRCRMKRAWCFAFAVRRSAFRCRSGSAA